MLLLRPGPGVPQNLSIAQRVESSGNLRYDSKAARKTRLLENGTRSEKPALGRIPGRMHESTGWEKHQGKSLVGKMGVACPFGIYSPLPRSVNQERSPKERHMDLKSGMLKSFAP